ncbi:hypothetical protein C8R43DRAFT_846175, partial [Mycena crocata]
MPRLSARQARARDGVKIFLHHHTTKFKSLLRRKNKSKKLFVQAGMTPQEADELLAAAVVVPDVETVSITMTSGSDSGDSSVNSSISTGLSTASSDSSSEHWSDLLGSDWHQSSASSESSSMSSSSSSGDGDDKMPELHPAGYPDSDSDGEEDSDSHTSSSSGSDSGGNADHLDVDMEDLLSQTRCLLILILWSRVKTLPIISTVKWTRYNLEQMYTQRYEMPRNKFPRGPAFMPHVLRVQKHTRPDLFREDIRMSPFIFDRLVRKIQTDPVFSNDSSNGQMPVEEQLAIALYRFGHSGNAASLQKVANWAGVGKGTITLVTRCVMTAILRPEFMAEFVCMPTAAEKEKSKGWVQAHSCKAWRDGWCMVNAPCVVALFDRPFWFGESYFDRKCNYSPNIQIVNLPNLRIIDFGYGFKGSTHDSMAWEGTRLAKEHETLLED